ncbi:MAG: ABC transporter substrate-binding protein [Candidatus Omnitrophica bacterium]|nr:ABC transporter substrate-binding protein [Candidatus Omnitrophota bacterium]
MKTKILSVIGICAVLAMTAGCGHKAPEKKPAKINIAFKQWVGYGPFFLARDKGFFGDEGIDLKFVDEQIDSARRDAFKAGMLDCEGGTIDLLVSKTAHDTPITAVLEIDSSYGGDGIVAANNIKSLKDLIGKKVAFTRDDVNQTFISYLFYKEGLSMDKITVVSCEPEKVAQAFLNGDADAAVTWEPWLSEALKRPDTHLLVSTKDRPGIIIDTLNVRNDLIKNDPGLIKGLMRGWFKAVKYYKEHPVEASEIIAKHYGITAEEYRKNVEKLRWIDHADQTSPDKRKELADIFNTIADIKLSNGRITRKPDAQKAMNATLLQELYNEDSR